MGSPSPGKECDILGVRYWGYGCANRLGKSLLPALSCSHGRAGRPPSWEKAAPVEEGLKRISTMFRKQDFVGASYWPDPPSHSRKWPVPSMSTKAPCLGLATPSISLGHLPNCWLKHYHVQVPQLPLLLCSPWHSSHLCSCSGLKTTFAQGRGRET